MPLGGQGGQGKLSWAGRSQGHSLCGGTRALLGPWDSRRLVWGGEAQKEEPTELILARWPHGPWSDVQTIYVC